MLSSFPSITLPLLPLCLALCPCLSLAALSSPPCLRCGTRQCAIRKPRCGSRRSGVARNPYKKHIPLPQEAKQHVQDIVESPQQRHFVCVTCPFPSLCSSYRNSLGATSLPVPCFLPLPFWVSIQLPLSSLNCGTNRKEKNRNQKRKKRGNSLGCQVPIVGFTFCPGPDKLKCPRTIPGVDFLFMCPLALSRSPLSSAYLAVFLSVFTSFFLFLPPVLRSCSASGKPLN